MCIFVVGFTALGEFRHVAHATTDGLLIAQNLGLLARHVASKDRLDPYNHVNLLCGEVILVALEAGLGLKISLVDALATAAGCSHIFDSLN